jgi:BASS family bile acid:Na+ symporter
MVRSSIEWVGRYGTLLMPIGIIIGCLFQPLAELLRPLLPATVFIMLTIVLSRMDVERAIAHLRSPKIFLLSLLWGFAVLPLLFVFLLQFVSISPGLRAALIIYATSPPNYAAAALAFVMGLDGALTVATIFAATALHPVVTPAFTDAFVPHAISISGFDLGIRLAGLIGGASLVAFGLSKYMGTARRMAASTLFDGLNVMIMIVFAIALMDGIPARVIAQPGYALALIALATGLHLGLNALTAFIFMISGKQRALTLGYAHAGRNIAVVMSVLGSAAPDDAWLFFAMLQFPIYCLPMLLKPLYKRMLPDAG